MIFYIGLAFRRWTDPKLLSNESILLVKRPRSCVDLQCVQPNVLRRKLSSKIKQRLADPSLLIIGMNIQLINELVIHRHKSNRTMIQVNHPKPILLQNIITKIISIFVEEVSFGALKLWK